MRTLQTQVRLRRLLRVYSEYSDRVAYGPGDVRLAEAARAKLFELAGHVHEAWSADSSTVAIPAIRRHVAFTLAGMDEAIASLGRRNTDPIRLADQLKDAAVPLLLMLRGMEDIADGQVLDWLGTRDLAKTA
ncbi:MAG: hypothetical protein M3Z13_07300 [Candidatus Dormibacteraeota bacterium]|nr:hypothetical protein [Candidatus Dormibacteraeota bacterium]